MQKGKEIVGTYFCNLGHDLDEKQLEQAKNEMLRGRIELSTFR